MAVGELLGASLRLVQRRFRSLAVCVLVVVAPLAVVSTLIQVAAIDHPYDFSDRTVTVQEGGTAAAGAIASSLLLALAVVLATGACFRVVEADVRRQAVTWQESLRSAAARMLPLVVSGILYVLGVGLGFVFCIVPGVFLAVAWSLVAPAVLYEDLGAVAALKRSQALVKGSWWRVFGAELLMLLIVALVQGLIGAVLGLLLSGTDDEAVNAVVATLVTIAGYVVSLPLQAALFALLFFDLRAREQAPAPDPSSWAAPDAPPSSWPPPSSGGFLPPEPPR